MTDHRPDARRRLSLAESLPGIRSDGAPPADDQADESVFVRIADGDEREDFTLRGPGDEGALQSRMGTGQGLLVRGVRGGGGPRSTRGTAVELRASSTEAAACDATVIPGRSAVTASGRFITRSESMSENGGRETSFRRWWHRERDGYHEIVDANGEVLVRESTQRVAVLSAFALAKQLGVSVSVVTRSISDQPVTPREGDHSNRICTLRNEVLQFIQTAVRDKRVSIQEAACAVVTAGVAVAFAVEGVSPETDAECAAVNACGAEVERVINEHLRPYVQQRLARN